MASLTRPSLSSNEAEPAPRFCHLCGEDRHDGDCRGERPPTRHRRWRRVVVAIVAWLVVMSGAGAWNGYSDVRDEVSSLESALDSSERRLSTLDGRVDDASDASASLTGRIANIEAELEAAPDPAAVAETVRRSVLTIETDFGGGSAFAVSTDGTSSRLVTNYHVVADVWSRGGRGVTLRQGESTHYGSILRVDTAADLALVEVPVVIPALALAASEPKPGDPVMIVGSPLGLEGSVASGVVSSMRDEDGVRYVQFSAPISPGNSGGPVVDAVGRVVGVAVSKFVGEGVEGLSFAIPVAQVCTKLEAGCT